MRGIMVTIGKWLIVKVKKKKKKKKKKKAKINNGNSADLASKEQLHVQLNLPWSDTLGKQKKCP